MSRVPVNFIRHDDGLQTVIDPALFMKISNWCRNTFSNGEWHIGVYYIWVRDEKMAALFALKWS